MKKYLVIRLEKVIGNHVSEYGVLIESCFEVLITFSGDYEVYEEALRYAEKYNKDHGVRTLVISGEVFGQV